MPKERLNIAEWMAIIFILIGVILLSSRFIGALLGEKQNDRICEFDTELCMVDESTY